MMELGELKVLKRRRLTSLLGLTLDGSRLEGVALRRNNGSLEIQHTFSVSLSLDPLTADPELVGREMRNHLDAAGVKERHCIVGLPMKWALTTHVEMPALEEPDVASFLQLEAERGFPCDAATLQISSSRCVLPGGKQYALLAGIPRNHLNLVQRVLREARLRPVSFSLGIAALQPVRTEASQGVLALAIGETQVGLQLTTGGGVAALRALEGTIEVEGSRRRLHVDAVAREARITLGQLPQGLRESIRKIRIFGPRDLAQQLADEAELRLEALGLEVEVVTRYTSGEWSLQLPADATPSPALSLAAGQLTGRPRPFEFLPPQVTVWRQLSGRYSSGKLRLAGAAAAVLLAMVGGVFGVQQWQLARYQLQWQGIAARVQELKQVQQQIQQFRPWRDETIRGLTILRQLTQAFPEDGAVSAKAVDMRDLAAVTCQGSARDYPALLKTLERLRATSGIADVRLSMIRGKSPMQFTFDFRWTEGGRREN